ncbi:MAG: GNAT family N-acetyltransferase [Bacteroidota bacterium]
MSLKVKHIKDEAELALAFKIREKVYIVEQQIARKDEFDEFDKISEHFLAYFKDIPAGTCRYRLTDNAVKLERFATLAAYRGKGIASALMERMIAHIRVSCSKKTKLYLNAQLTAMPLYSKFDFCPEGAVFMECGIEHQKMSRLL